MYKISYTGDGQSTEFFFDFKWFQPADIQVFIDGKQAGENIYAVSKTTADPDYESAEQAAANSLGIQTFFGGRLDFMTAPKPGAVIEIIRKVALSRTVCYQPTKTPTFAELNTDFDYLTEYLRDLGALETGVLELYRVRSELDSLYKKYQDLLAMTDVARPSDIPDVRPIIESINKLALDIDEKIAAIHQTVSGMDAVIESSAPGANPWFRKYKSGWIEQGGYVNAANGNNSVNLPIVMSSADYHFGLNAQVDSSNARIVQGLNSMTASQLRFVASSAFEVHWCVSGYAA